jgi:hypothetical protein
MTSLIDLGIVTGEQRYVQLGRQLYDVGLHNYRTSYGWAAEDLPRCDRGEANNTGDFIEAAILLGVNVDGSYFHDAERFMRNGLLASQIVNIDWIPQSDEKDTHDYVYSDIRRRVCGAFVFTTPNGYHSYNTDLMGGAIQSLSEAYRAIVSQDPSGCHVNMLFNAETPWLTVRSNLPEVGSIEVETHRDSAVFVRLPEWVNRRKVAVSVAGQKHPCRWQDKELFAGNIPAKTKIEICFEQRRLHTIEQAYSFGAFDIDWLGDTIVAMAPSPTDSVALY